MLEAKAIRVTLGSREVVRGIDLSAPAGTVTCIIGPNGSGKTTFLRALTGDVPFSGTVRLGGQETSTLRAWQLAERRAVLPQATTLAFPFTAGEVVAIGLHAGAAGDDAHVVRSALARVGLPGAEDRPYHALSGGEQQRVQLARVLAQVWQPVSNGEPRWLFLDEPVSSLDIGHQLAVMQIARDFASAGGGVVAVMHDLNLSAIYADCMVCLSEGQLIAAGLPAEVMTDTTLSVAYGCDIRVNTAPPAGASFVLPHMAASA